MHVFQDEGSVSINKMMHDPLVEGGFYYMSLIEFHL